MTSAYDWLYWALRQLVKLISQLLRHGQRPLATIEPDNGNLRDSRRVARALIGDYPGASNDFQRQLE